MITDLPPQFMNYTLKWDGIKQKYMKAPCTPNGLPADAHNPANWMTHDQALAIARFDYEQPDQPYGVAFVLAENDPYFFLDLDDCLQADGTWSPAATAIYSSFSGAIGEVSISGKGLHVIGKCNPAMLQDRKNKWDGWLEFYTQKRFIALGTQGFNQIGAAENSEIDWTQQLLRIVPQRATLGELPQGVDPDYTGETDDNKLIAKMVASVGSASAAFGGKATVAQLWKALPVLCQMYPDAHGDANKFDHSSADAALMAHLAFWTGKDMPRMERLFRMSKLMRPKFDRPPGLSGESYKSKTIQDAARMCNRVYDFKKPESTDAVETMEAYLTMPEMITHFDGCVYVRELHKVLLPDGTMIKPEQFKAYFGGHMFQMEMASNRPEKNAFIAFTENRMHRFPKVIKSGFDPQKEFMTMIDDQTINTFKAENGEITQGDITPFLTFIEKLLPAQSDRDILTAYLAAVVQNPGVKFQWAPVLQGAEGNGKTFLANCAAYVVGSKHTHRPNSKQLAEKFNAYIENNLFIIVEEIDMQGKREMLDVLKPLVTNVEIEVRGMQQEKRMVRNWTNWIFCTNFQDAVLKSKNDRRYCMFFTAQQSYADIVRDGMNGRFFPDLYKWANNGGYAAVGYYLMHYPIPDHLNPATDCHRAPVTTTTEIAIAKSTGFVEREIEEATQDGTQGFKGGFISSFALEKLMYGKNIKLSLNKRAEILEEMGYMKHPSFTNGRFPRVIMEENNKRPVIYVTASTLIEENAADQYIRAQTYMSAQPV